VDSRVADTISESVGWLARSAGEARQQQLARCLPRASGVSH